MKETIKLVTEGGSFALLVAVLIGLLWLARSVVPAIKDFFVALTTRLGDLKTDTEIIKTKMDMAGGAASSAYRSGGEALDKVEDAVRCEAVEIKEAISSAERRITAAVWREQDSELPRSSKTPARQPGTARTSR